MLFRYDHQEPGRSHFTIVSHPAGARIEIDGVDAGTAPVTVELPPFTHIEIRAEIEGYPDGIIELDDVHSPELEIDLRPAPSSAGALDGEPRFGTRPWAPFVNPVVPHKWNP